MVGSSSSSLFLPLFFFFFFFFFTFFICANSTHIYKGLVVTEKTRLGSRPPSCHNKCNQCHPCFAVQVPSFPTHSRRLRPEFSSVEKYLYPLPVNRYSYYKPLGWRCRCGAHVYNP